MSEECPKLHAYYWKDDTNMIGQIVFSVYTLFGLAILYFCLKNLFIIFSRFRIAKARRPLFPNLFILCSCLSTLYFSADGPSQLIFSYSYLPLDMYYLTSHLMSLFDSFSFLSSLYLWIPLLAVAYSKNAQKSVAKLTIFTLCYLIAVGGSTYFFVLSLFGGGDVCKNLENSTNLFYAQIVNYSLFTILVIVFSVFCFLLGKKMSKIYEFKHSKTIKRMKALAILTAVGGIVRTMYNISFFASETVFVSLRANFNLPNGDLKDSLIYAALQLTYYPITHLIPLLFLVYNFQLGTRKSKKVNQQQQVDDTLTESMTQSQNNITTNYISLQEQAQSEYEN